MDTKDFLKRTALFAQCSDTELDQVLGTARERTWDTGAKIVRAGDEGGRGFYLLIEGAAEVIRDGTVVATPGPGDYFGEMALLLEGAPRNADVVATEPTTCLVMTQWDFRALLENHPDISTKVMMELARRLAGTDGAPSD